MEFLPSLADNSRVWIYLSDRKFTSDESNALSAALKDFVSQWKAHGTQLSADFQLMDGQVIFIGVDESMQNATGCSIDSQVHFMQELGKQLHADFFNRQLLALCTDAGLSVISFEALNKGLSSGEFSPENKVLDHLQTSLGGLRAKGVVALKDSWHMNLVSA